MSLYSFYLKGQQKLCCFLEEIGPVFEENWDKKP
jgi:hypothetical protein